MSDYVPTELDATEMQKLIELLPRSLHGAFRGNRHEGYRVRKDLLWDCLAEVPGGWLIDNDTLGWLDDLPTRVLRAYIASQEV